jgi:hypothetical protein
VGGRDGVRKEGRKGRRKKRERKGGMKEGR